MKPLPYILLIFLIAVLVGSIPVLTGCTLTISIKGKEKVGVEKIEPVKVESDNTGNHIGEANKMVGENKHNTKLIFTPTPLHDPYGFYKKEKSKSNYDAVKDSLYGTWRNLPNLPDDHKANFQIK